MSVTVILCQAHYCILGADNLFFSFTDPQVERNFTAGCIILTLNLDYFNVFRFGTFMLRRFWTLN